MAVELSRRAVRDLRRFDPQDRARTLAGLARLDHGEPALDAKPLTGHPGWLELRVGELRILYRRQAADPLALERNWWVERIVHRQNLTAAVRTL